jgi:nucleotide sugar dehydrogenase
MKIIRNINQHIVNENSRIDELLAVLNKKVSENFGTGFAVVVNKIGLAVGVIQDSDLRRFLTRFPNTDIKISKIMNTNFISVKDDLNEHEIFENILVQLDSRGWYTNLPVKIIPMLSFGKPTGLVEIEEIDLDFRFETSNFLVIGLGYVGLTIALALANSGKKVIGVDTNPNRINDLNNFTSYIFEPGIDSLLMNHLGRNLFIYSKIPLENRDTAEKSIFFICIGSPLNSKFEPELNDIWKCIEEISRLIKKDDVIVMRSTVPVGFGRKIILFIESCYGWKVGLDFNYISAPERTVEGNALKEIRDLPQILAGATNTCHAIGLKIFNNLSSSITNLKSIEGAELVKLIGNAYRDYTFGFANYFIEVCKFYELDINEIINSSNRGYPRSTIPNPSPGVGGPCLSKDSYFINSDFIEHSPLIAARTVNSKVPSNSVKFIKDKIPHLNLFRCLGIGLAFKGIPETNDLRNSPSIDFLDSLLSHVSSIHVWDSSIKKDSAELKFLYDDMSTDINFFAILNNNQNNLIYFKNRVLTCQEKEIIVFDPWRLIVPNQVFDSKKIKTVNYFSLSHFEKFSF